MMAWMRGDHRLRAAELQEMARIQCRRTTQSRWDQLHVTLETPGDKHSRFVVMREGNTSKLIFAKHTQVQKYIRGFYANLSIDRTC